MRMPIVVVLENIRSLWNVGAMFRTSDAAGVQKIFLTGTTGCPPDASIDKTALGATDVVPWEYAESSSEKVAQLKREGFFIVALERTAEAIQYTEANYTFPLCLVVGNEVDGISGELLALADMVVQIPMLGRARSLNVATAYGVALYEILRHYRSV